MAEGSWLVRSRHLVLVPGDSPIGLRLPLASLPWQETDTVGWAEALDPMAPRGSLPPIRTVAPPRVHSPHRMVLGDPPRAALIHPQKFADPDRTPKPGESATWVVRTALAVEARDGRLHVFMPPLHTADDYLELVAAIEATARELDAPVALEGYLPPFDPRLEKLAITPDPGVIEVNVQPVASWRELVDDVTALYEIARISRLGTEKFMLDGRHSGTGGGNHIVIGGATPADSPVLRRPDLLRSLVGYWLNHPSLSYLFSGLFVGPDQPGTARGRGASRERVRAGDRVRADPRAGDTASVPRGWWIASFATC